MATKRPLRKGLRASLVVTVVALMTTLVIDLGSNGFYATFSVVLLLMLADFGGPPKSRFLANIITGLAGMVMIALGAVVAQNIAASLIVTALVSFALAYAVVLRGYVGTAFASVLLPYVVAVTTALPVADVPVAVLAFGAGTLISAIAAVTLWPVYQTSQIRKAVGKSLKAAASVLSDSTPLNQQATEEQMNARLDELLAANQELESVYSAQLDRPGSATGRDRGLVLLIDNVSRLRISLRWPSVRTAQPTEADVALVRASQESLEACGNALTGDGPVPDADKILAARMEHIQQMPVEADELLRSHRCNDLKEAINASFYYRMTAFLTAMIVRHTQEAMGQHHKIPKNNTLQYPNATTVAHIDAASSPLKILRSHLSFESPWFRRALQTSIGVTLSVAVVEFLHLDHGFWVVLGIIAALKLNASDTRKTALGAVAGTVVGFVIVAIMLLLIGGNTLPLMILLPFVVFLATWGPAGPFAFPMKQAGFTVLFIMLGSLANGLSLQLGTIRLQDVGIGLVICLVVTSLLWPRGVAAEVRKVLTDSVRATVEYLVESYNYITSPMTEEDVQRLHTVGRAATTARIRAKDEFDVALSQGGQIGIDARDWSAVANGVDHVFFASILTWSVQSFGLAPIPFKNVAARMRQDARFIGDQYIEAINASYTIDEDPNDPSQSGKPVKEPQEILPVVDTATDLPDLAKDVDQALQHCDGCSGPYNFEIDGHKFESTYANASVSALWAQDWLLYFHWMASQTVARIESAKSVT